MLEILLKYLPENGGWPEGVNYIADNGNGHAFQYRTKGMTAGSPVHYLMRIDSTGMETVTREQYESAFAAKNENLVWDGEGLPPVGVECEFAHLNRNESTIFWERGIVRYLSCHTIVIEFTELKNGKAESVSHPTLMRFRPIRSPENVARDEATKAMNEVWRKHAGKEHNGKLFSIYEIIYEGILAGKIPGVHIIK